MRWARWGCSPRCRPAPPRFAGTRLTVATGGTQGVYLALCTALAQTWHDRLGLATRPQVLATPGRRRCRRCRQAEVEQDDVDAGEVIDGTAAPGQPRV